ncbi:universal stress protein [Rhodobacteraceae bacterium LMO-12]|nr:universal stress protein [Rhodobacteraceae bacterium LMO-JJ12]
MAIKSVLAAIGHFPQDEAVLARALEIAALHRAGLVIVHVIDLPEPYRAPGDHDTLHGQAAFAAHDRIEAALAGHESDTPDIVIRIVSGTPALELIEICDVLRPDLIVMRAHQKTGFTDRFLGSTTDRVIASGITPVLVVKQPRARDYGNVLVATDGSDDAPGTLAYVAELLPGAALHLTQAVEITLQLEEAMLRIGLGQTGLNARRKELANKAEAHMRVLANTLTPPPSIRVLRGNPSTEIARATREPDIDLLALGPGRTGLIRRAFIGSVTRRLLRDAHCDVLIHHPQQTAHQSVSK